MRNTAVVYVLALAAVASTVPAHAAGLVAATAFDQLKSLAGTWEGSREGEGMVAEVNYAPEELVGEAEHEFRVTAAGTVVMEMMRDPARHREMVTMYYLDGDDLVLTHYCHGGNQPRMRLNRELSKADKLVFEFDGATNLEVNPQHVHAAEIDIVDADHLKSVWMAYNGDEAFGKNTFTLTRAK